MQVASWQELRGIIRSRAWKGRPIAVVYALSTWKLLLVQALWRFHRQSSRCLSAVQAAFEQTWGEMGNFFGWVPFYYSPSVRKMNPADPLTRRSEADLWGELGCLEFSLDLHLEEAQLIENGYADDQEMQHIINRLLTAGDDDSFQDKYYWDAAKNRLSGWLDSSSSLHSTRTCSPQAPSREPRLYHCQTSRQRQNRLELVRAFLLARNGEVGEGICPHLRHVSATQECKNRSWSPSTPTCTGKTMGNDQHVLYHGPAKNSTTSGRCVYLCGQNDKVCTCDSNNINHWCRTCCSSLRQQCFHVAWLE